MGNLKFALPTFAFALLAHPMIAAASPWDNLGGTFASNIAPGMSKGQEVNPTFPNEGTINAYFVDMYSHNVINYEMVAAPYTAPIVSYLGGQTSHAPSAVQWTNHREVVIVANDNNLYFSTSDSNQPFAAWEWAGYDQPVTGICSDPSALSWGPGRVDVFVLGCDNYIYQATHLNGKWNWANRGSGGAPGVPSGPPVAAAPDGARVDVWTSLRGQIEDDQYNGSGWTGRLAGPPNGMWNLSTSPIHANGGNNVISGVVVGTDNRGQLVGLGDDMWSSHGFTNTAASGLTGWGIPSTATFSTNSIVVYAVDSQQHVARTRLQFNGFQASFVQLSNSLGAPSGDLFQGRVGVMAGLTENGSESIFVFAIKSNGNLWYATDAPN